MAEKGIKHILNAIATPRANGQVERPNRTIVQALAASADTESRWDEKLPDIVWGFIQVMQVGTRFSPSQLMFSYDHGAVAGLADGELASTAEADELLHGEGEAVSGNEIVANTTGRASGAGGGESPGDGLADITPHRRRLTANRDEVSDRIRRAAQRMKATYDRRRKSATTYKVGDLVLWRQANTSKAGEGMNRKLSNKFDGPFRVAKVLGNDRYLIEAIKGVTGYKRFQATVAVESIRRYHGVNQTEVSEDEMGESGEETDRLDLIDLLES